MLRQSIRHGVFRSRLLNRYLSQGKSQGNTHASNEEVSHFNALASSWWDVDGPQRILHKMNLVRMDFVNDMIRLHLKLNQGIEDPEDQVYMPPFNVNLLPKPVRARILQEQEARRDEMLNARRLRVLDVGCGGGIFSESFARLPYVELVKGIDLSPDVLTAANWHKKLDPVLEDKLSYELQAVGDDRGKYDVVTAFEMLEHVPYPAEVLNELFQRVEDGGWVFISTINRDFVSWFTTIFVAETAFRIVPKGTHTLEKYINEHEIREWLAQSEHAEKFKHVKSKGSVFVPALGWTLTDCPGTGNFFMAFQKVR